MLKILLVYDDFQELTSVELMLKKIGFDVVGITSEFSLAEQLLSFNPQIVVAQGRTAKVSTSNVGRRLRESARWDGQSILIFYPNAKPQPTELLRIRMDVGLEYPVEPTKMVQVLAQLGSLDSNQLLDKLIKSMATEPASTGGSANTSFSNRAESDSVFVSGSKLEKETAASYGGAAGANSEAQKALSNSELPAATENKISGSTQAPDTKQGVAGGVQDPASQQNLKGTNEAGHQNPLFPLGGKAEENSSNSVTGSTLNNDDPMGLKGGFGNAFQLGNLTNDPLMQELENLLQNKPDLSLKKNPSIQDEARHKKYEEYMKTIPIQQLSSIKRTHAKTRLRDLIKDIDKHELEDQDVLRREYVKALFKKEG